ncbi:MAG: hypothetical protein RL346_1870 [Verrucomicrobiota bacterium]|jgi:FkbM family methyltransferase
MPDHATYDPCSPEKPWGHYEPRTWVRIWLRLLHALPATKFMRRLALWLRKPLKKTLKGWVDIRVWGLHLRLRSTGNLSEQRVIYMPQYFDSVERHEIAKALQAGGTFFDIGANAGAYSLWVASLQLPGVRIEAFEPDPKLCESLHFNLRSNSIDSVRVHGVALGNRDGLVSLLAEAENKGENRIVDDAGEDTLQVEMTTLPAFIRQHQITRIDAMKIDIEGHEMNALTPLFESCPRSVWPGIVICELIHDTDMGLNKLLQDHGYQLYGKGRLNGIYKKTIL